MVKKMNILITGAASGIARRVIEKLKKKDVYIYVTTHTEKECALARERYKMDPNIKCMKLDVTKVEDRKKVSSLSIDVLICNAAIGVGGSFLEINMDKVRDNFETNVFSNFALVQLVLSNMIKKKGRIIMLSSLAGLVPIPFLGSYCATKASIIKIVETLRMEVSMINQNIDFVLIEPGFYKTGFNEIMFDNKYGSMDTLFYKEIELIRARENFLLCYVSSLSFDSIAKKIVDAATCIHPKRVYKAPMLEAVFAKLYLLFFA